MGLTLRNVKGSSLTYSEMDNNLLYLQVLTTGSLNITGSIISSLGFTGSLLGTASNSISASNSNTSSYVLTSQTASFVQQAVSSSFSATASILLGSITSASYAATASMVLTAQTSSFVVNSTYLKFGFGGKLFQSSSDAGCASSGETDLYSFNSIAGTLGKAGEQIKAEYGGIFVGSGTATKQIRIYFGGNLLLDTGTISTPSNSSWNIYLTINMVSTSVIRYIAVLTTGGASVEDYNSVSEIGSLNLSNANILKITGQTAGPGAASNDIVAKLGYAIWLPAV